MNNENNDTVLSKRSSLGSKLKNKLVLEQLLHINLCKSKRGKYTEESL